MMQTTQKIQLFINKDREGKYFEQPFEVPENVSRIDIRYSYPRHVEIVNGSEVEVHEKNIIDLALQNADNEFIGASGSNRTHIWISEYNSSLGYAETQTKKGQWNVIVGAYKVMDGGVMVEYEFTFTHKERILLKGDLHMHTLGSDGTLTVDEIVSTAKKSGLQYIFITDHNNYFHNNILKSDADITVMPGVEWTHFKGHVNMLGIKKAYDGAFYTNTIEETREKLKTAREKGAIVSINHPFCPDCGFTWGLENVEYDCIELWNGPRKREDLDCLEWWHNELCKGRKIPVLGGSDFHRYEMGKGIGMPTTCLYAMSKAPSDIYTAIREGCGFITYEPNGPAVDAECDGKTLGQTVEYKPGLKIVFEFSRLCKGDILKIISDKQVEEITWNSNAGQTKCERLVGDVMFYRTEIHRCYANGFPSLPVMISNPVYILTTVKDQ
jgi:hypothetical protein